MFCLLIVVEPVQGQMKGKVWRAGTREEDLMSSPVGLHWRGSLYGKESHTPHEGMSRVCSHLSGSGANLTRPQGVSVVRGPSSRVGHSRRGGWDVQSMKKWCVGPTSCRTRWGVETFHRLSFSQAPRGTWGERGAAGSELETGAWEQHFRILEERVGVHKSGTDMRIWVTGEELIVPGCF